MRIEYGLERVRSGLSVECRIEVERIEGLLKGLGRRY